MTTAPAAAGPGRVSRALACLGALGEGRRVAPRGVRRWLIALLATPLTVFEIWLALRGALQPLTIGMLFVSVLYPVSFLTVSSGPRLARITWLDWLLAGLSALAGGYLLYRVPAFAQWIAGIDEFTGLDLAAGGTLLLLSLELLRRCVGFGLLLVTLALVAYVLLGHFIPGSFGHRPLGLAFFIEEITISASGGLFGLPIQVAATYAFLFVLFGRLIERSGGGRFFFDAAAALAGRRPGGVAKVAVVASALFGTLSGSPAADVMTTGSVTIPAMRRLGYSATFAGAVESVASTGGSLLPPVMGAVIFLMAEFTGIGYLQIAVAALFVALLYYLAIYRQVHLRALRDGLQGLPPEQIVGLPRALAEGWQTLPPFVVLVGLLAAGYTPAFVAAAAGIAALVASWLRRSSAIGPRGFVAVTVETVHALAPLVAAVAAAGIVIAALNLTSLAGKLSSLIFMVSQGSQAITLLIAAAATLLLGMGMPVIAAYALVAVLVAPVLVDAGIPLLQAHLFLVYYAVLSAITPPIAIACYVASSIADARPMGIARQAVQLALVAFVIPLLFVYRPGLLLQGGPVQILPALLATAGAVWLWCNALAGWWRGPLQGLQGAAVRLLLGVGGVALVWVAG